MDNIPQQVSISASTEARSYTKPFITVTFLFFMWGFITVMNDVLIPHLRAVFELSYFKAALVQFAFFGAFFIVSLLYFFISAYKGDPIAKLGYKNGILVGLFLCGLGCFLFYPAASYQIYGFFLSALFILASGVTVLQIAANPYAAILGKPATASSRLNLAQGFNSFGTTLAPVIGALLVYKVFSDGDISVDSLKLPYIIYGLVFLVLALMIKMVHLPSFSSSDKIETGAKALQYRHVVLGMIAIFMYVGGEVSIGSFLINLFAQEQIMGLSEAAGGIFLSYYWGGAMTGRFLGAISLGSLESRSRKYLLMLLTAVASFIVIYFVTSIRNENGQFYFELMALDKLAYFFLLMALNYAAFMLGGSKPARTLTIFSLAVVGLLLTVSFSYGQLAFWAAIGIGLFNSIMWSNIFTLAIKDLGKYTSQASSLLVMMIVGGAIVPPLQGALADAIGIQLSFMLPVLCYLYLIFYGLKGHQIIKPQS
ncbi:glucose/galactose transporter family protein [Fulvivirga imtechensis AK7]|uniref:Glucose/galactose transporter family protein n=1 Tax=Fulvivirga imtechensis AK7 TaxID=1237149 RepID=L8JTL0_9BACT|nr:sugar MFS transporter [Fulvivirga imtechensis]ELR72150.1 glucose/galactose transporter family protein [Fulvivirga imtechensis AK7]